MDQPLVSVICLCYNHEPFIQEALESVFHQTYKNIQVIVVDDGSTDQSVRKIQEVIGTRQVEFLSLKENLGNCKAFNRGLALAKGMYVVDFATDDLLHQERISKQINAFEKLDRSWGVLFTDAVYINRSGDFLRNHYDYLFQKGLLNQVPEGDVYTDVLDKYFIASPTMIVRKEVFDVLNGYDEELAYEDFDFWVRAARQYKFTFLNEKLTTIRRSHGSMSDGWYIPGDKQLHSTYLVCRKAQQLNRSSQEINALAKRVKYELRQSVFSENYREADLFYRLLKDIDATSTADRVACMINTLRLPLSRLRKLYHRLRYDTF